MKTIDIKGKPYVMVHERVKEFLATKPGWRLVNEVVLLNADECAIVCKVYNEDDKLMSTGHGYERAASGNINKTSHVENCETSAVGRALGFIGIGIDTSIRSAEEEISTIRDSQKPILSPLSSNWSKAEEAGKAGKLTAEMLDKYDITEKDKLYLLSL